MNTVLTLSTFGQLRASVSVRGVLAISAAGAPHKLWGRESLEVHCDGPGELLTSEEVEENAHGVVPTRVRHAPDGHRYHFSGRPLASNQSSSTVLGAKLAKYSRTGSMWR